MLPTCHTPFAESEPPTDLRTNSTSSTTITFRWAEPRDAVPGYLTYKVTCTSSLLGTSSESNITAPGAMWAELTRLEEGTEFTCSVRSQLHGYVSSMSGTITVTTTTIG